jgi:hypothetical protein
MVAGQRLGWVVAFEAEVDRLLKLGARTADVGQGEQPWVVLADPESSEFCVLPPRRRQPLGTQPVVPWTIR